MVYSVAVGLQAPSVIQVHSGLSRFHHEGDEAPAENPPPADEPGAPAAPAEENNGESA